VNESALLVLCSGAPPALEGAPPHTIRAAPAGFDPLAAWLALLGQDPVARWRGQAPFALAAAGGVQAEDETAYLLSPVRVAGRRIEEVLELGPNTQREVLDLLEEALEDEVLTLRAGPLGPSLALAEEVPGPPQVAHDSLVGRELDDLPAGPPGLLARLIQASAQACSEAGRPRGATHLFPHGPARAEGFEPIREAWLGLSGAAFVGGPLAHALATLLGGTHWPARPEDVLQVAKSRKDALVVAVEPADPSLLELTGCDRVALAGPPQASPTGVELTLRLRGPAPASADLRDWVLGA
jgi:hypothetical protein